ncbi:MAG: T9SS type A sorting domain-containing protein [Bacteroidetes bacterium]|nr:T9SS type A sorting domain-containing protein [Bacteroidota bacterium]
MKKSLTKICTIVLLAVSTVAIAQPKLTTKDIPVDGWKIIMKNGDYTTLSSVGSAGASQSWDFSALNPNKASDSTTVEYLKSAGTPYDTSFKSATLARKEKTTQGLVYSYLGTISDKLTNYGYAVKVGAYGIIASFTDTGIEQSYPIAYQDKSSDAFSGTYSLATTHYLRGTTTVEADAYGTVKLSAATFTNVLRLHRIRMVVDSTFLGFGSLVTTTTNETWEYMQPGTATPILLITKTTTKGITGTSTTNTVAYTIANITSIKALENASPVFSIYPNPAKTELNINLSKPAIIASIQIINMLGQVMLSETVNADGNNLKLNISNLPKGIYLLKLSTNGSNATQRLVVE